MTTTTTPTKNKRHSINIITWTQAIQNTNFKNTKIDIRETLQKQNFQNFQKTMFKHKVKQWTTTNTDYYYYYCWANCLNMAACWRRWSCCWSGRDTLCVLDLGVACRMQGSGSSSSSSSNSNSNSGLSCCEAQLARISTASAAGWLGKKTAEFERRRHA